VPLAFQCKNAAASIGMGLPAAVISRRAAASQLLRGDAKERIMVTANAVRADKDSSQTPARPARPCSLAVLRLATRAGQRGHQRQKAPLLHFSVRSDRY
jgi:hypothetical protein